MYEKNKRRRVHRVKGHWKEKTCVRGVVEETDRSEREKRRGENREVCRRKGEERTDVEGEVKVKNERSKRRRKT